METIKITLFPGTVSETELFVKSWGMTDKGLLSFVDEQGLQNYVHGTFWIQQKTNRP